MQPHSDTASAFKIPKALRCKKLAVHKLLQDKIEIFSEEWGAFSCPVEEDSETSHNIKNGSILFLPVTVCTSNV